MDLRSERAAGKRVLGTMAIGAGFLISLITMGSDSGYAEPHVLAFLLALTGIGLRVEAAINASRA